MATPRATLVCFCTLTGLFCAGAQMEEAKTNCSSFEKLSTQLQEAAACGRNLAGLWMDNQTAVVLDSLRTLTDILQKHQKTVCQNPEAMQPTCPTPRLEGKGGLVCVFINKKRYCKPMCNEGYDFAFLRRSRVYEQCGADSSFTWTTQYVGGSRLAICSKSSTAISGAAGAYFPKDQDCLKTKMSSDLEARVTQEFLSELKAGGVEGERSQTCLICA